MEFAVNEGRDVLARTPAVLRGLLTDLADPWLRNNEGGDTWSPFDILGHLIHGEKTDWIPRTRIILSQTAEPAFAPFDRFAQEKDSAGKSTARLLDEFESLRRSNLEALAEMELTARELELEGIHPAFGTVSLKQLLATWVVHDLGHIAQISRVMANQYNSAVGPWRQYLRVLGSAE